MNFDEWSAAIAQVEDYPTHIFLYDLDNTIVPGEGFGLSDSGKKKLWTLNLRLRNRERSMTKLLKDEEELEKLSTLLPVRVLKKLSRLDENNIYQAIVSFNNSGRFIPAAFEHGFKKIKRGKTSS